MKYNIARNRSLLFFCSLVICFSYSAASARTLKAQAGKVSFLAIGKPSFLKINGIAKSGEDHKIPQGDLLIKQDDTLSGELVMDLDSFDTGISLRNEHMKEKYLETKKFPQAKLILNDFSVAQAIKSKSSSFSGVLELHGVKKQVGGTIDLAASGSGYVADASFSILLSDYNIEIPSYLGVKVADKVEVHAELKFNE